MHTPGRRAQEQLVNQRRKHRRGDVRQRGDECIPPSCGLEAPDGHGHQASTEIARGVGGNWTAKSDHRRTVMSFGNSPALGE